MCRSIWPTGTVLQVLSRLAMISRGVKDLYGLHLPAESVCAVHVSFNGFEYHVTDRPSSSSSDCCSIRPDEIPQLLIWLLLKMGFSPQRWTMHTMAD